ncbi:hypothetical protein EG849_02025 [Flavobacterium macacae]|uniref:Uncharacterized protein n=1 Tax=Flavobacterium macacae TaxID=2488993 RepID=A0A3P3WGQ6_9FLAO|nr:hypothetical protein EG849_02025 [Flavobacterium macacae]
MHLAKKTLQLTLSFGITKNYGKNEKNEIYICIFSNGIANNSIL